MASFGLEEDYLITRDLLAEAPGPRLELEWAATCEEALERLAQGGIDAVLVDYHLGRVSGLDFVREASVSGHRTPMVLLTGQGDRDIDCQAMGAGASDFLVKGEMTSAVLERALRYAMERRRSEEALRAARDELAEANSKLRREVGERLRAETEVARLTIEDSLTGLPNRALFLDRLDQALEGADQNVRGLAVLFLDLDDFKLVNDGLGYEAGDRVLVVVAERLGAAMRGGDTVARFGDDKFTILLDDIRDEGDALAVAERVLAAVGRAIMVGDREIVPRCSIGLAIAAPGRDRTEHLLGMAEVALHRAKAEGKARCVLFTESEPRQALNPEALDAVVHRALDRADPGAGQPTMVELPRVQAAG